MACENCSNALVTEIDRDLERVERVQRNQGVALLLAVGLLVVITGALLRKGVLTAADLMPNG